MARTKAKTGFGSKLKIGDGGSPTEAFTALGELRGPLSVSGQAWDFDDATVMDSPDQYREEIPTLKSNAELSLELNYDPANTTYETALKTAFEAGTLTNFQLHLPASTSKMITFAAFVASHSITVVKDGTMVLAVSLKMQGKYTVAAAA